MREKVINISSLLLNTDGLIPIPLIYFMENVATFQARGPNTFIVMYTGRKRQNSRECVKKGIASPGTQILISITMDIYKYKLNVTIV